MIEQDTVKLLRECDAGIKMGVSSIDEVLDIWKREFLVADPSRWGQDRGPGSPSMRQLLDSCRQEHEKLKNETRTLLRTYCDQGKDANPLAKGMSWMKTNMKLGVDDSDQTIADLMTDGCNMGVKSLNRYLNQYKAASESSKDIARRLIDLEHQLSLDMRPFL